MMLGTWLASLRLRQREHTAAALGTPPRRGRWLVAPGLALAWGLRLGRSNVLGASRGKPEDFRYPGDDAPLMGAARFPW